MRVPASERRQQLIEAAVRLMWRDGVEKATLRAIAKEAGAPLASVHYCFTDKDELMQAAVEHWLGELVGSITEDIEVEGGLRSVVRRIADGFWLSLEMNPPNVLAQLELVLWAIREGGHNGLAQSIYARHEQVLGDVFARALSCAGEQSSVPTEQIARAFVGALDAGSLQFLADPTSTNPREVFDLMINSLLAAVLDGRNTIASQTPKGKVGRPSGQRPAPRSPMIRSATPKRSVAGG